MKNGKVELFYTLVNKSQGNRPVLIFEPKEFEAYKAGSLSTRGLYLLSPQWSFDIGSAALYADEEKSLGYITDAVTSPEYIFTAITSTMGASAYLGKSSDKTGHPQNEKLKIIKKFTSFQKSQLAMRLSKK